ncbi:hypothetical protein COI96_25150 [Priestia megaterium]|uniref:reverse transcriptase domain-containing protein n=1 Tax=Priestia megaterium TaxID=1404 RepID=UPI000BF35615|nr:reverse transcriptase domain-containing protein [Priestia megaterium]PFJ96338.1 hypothetical protein COI96_25150 [Priestia megaterium]
MIKDPFGKEELYIAWMRCRYFIYQDVKNFRIDSEVKLYDEYVDQIILELHSRLKNEKYVFSNKQLFLMPKNNGLLRRNSFMTIEDQIVSHAILNFIGRKIDSKFYNWSCANRIPKKKTNFSAPTFIPYLKQYNRFLNQTAYRIKKENRWVCETDIVSYFDHIDHNILLSQLNKHLKGEKYSYITNVLIDSYLKAPYALQGIKKESIKGIPQGGALAYFLSNLYLNDLDHVMKNYTNFNYVRYVDDIRIIGKTKHEVEKSLLKLQTSLWELGLEINSGKTKIYEIEGDRELEKFKQEQEEKLSSRQDSTDEERYISFQKYKIIIEENTEAKETQSEFKELQKLRERKINFLTNRLIKNGDPSGFPLLVFQLKDKPQKAHNLLGNVYKYRYKEKQLNVIDINNSYLKRPYEPDVGASILNLYNWGLASTYHFDEALPSDTGIVELYLINNSKFNGADPLLVTFIINKIFNRLSQTNIFLINSILYQMANTTYFSPKYKNIILDKIVSENIHQKNNCTQFIANVVLKDKVLRKEFKESKMESQVIYLDYLRSKHKELYELLISDEVYKHPIQVTEGYLDLEEFHSKLNGVNDIYFFIKKLIDLIKDNEIYMNNPVYVNAKNIWIKSSLYNGIEIKLNPIPLKDLKLYLSTPEDLLDRNNIKSDSKISFIVGLLAYSLFLENIEQINKLYLPYIEFNPISVWEHNNNEFKGFFKKEEIKNLHSKESFYELLDIIKKMTRKNPKTRLSISNFHNYLEGTQKKEVDPMKFFISHSTRDKGRINLYTDVITTHTSHQVIVDTHDFIPGEVIGAEIKKNIDKSDMLIVFYSQHVLENFKWVMDEVEYAIQNNKPFVCVLLDDIKLPTLLKGESEKLHFIHKKETSIDEIKAFIYKLEGLDYEAIKSKVNVDSYNVSNLFIQYLERNQVDLEVLLDEKYFDIFDALTRRKDLKLAPEEIISNYLKGADINSSNYKGYIKNLKYYGIIDTRESGEIVKELKITHGEFHTAILEAKSRYSPYWMEYLMNSIRVEVSKE